jgi:hypothetical protein
MSPTGHPACHLFFGAFGRQPPRRKKAIGRSAVERFRNVGCMAAGYAFPALFDEPALGQAALDQSIDDHIADRAVDLRRQGNDGR